MTTTAGHELKRWRTARRMSQLDLASAAGVSQRHLSFLETGRAKPSREMVLHLARELDVPLRDRNAWLRAAGFVEEYPAHRLEGDELAHVRHVVQGLLDAYAPFPAYVIDRAWNIVMVNAPAGLLTSSLVDPEDAQTFDGNVIRLMLHPRGLRRHVTNWESAAAALLVRFQRDVAQHPGDPELSELEDEVLAYDGVAGLDEPGPSSSSDLVLSLDLDTAFGPLSFLTTIATIGAAYDVTVEELRIETLLPADAATEATLRSMASGD